MLINLAIWFLEKRNASVIIGYRVNGGTLTPKQKKPYVYNNTFINTEHRFMDNQSYEVPEGDFEFREEIKTVDKNETMTQQERYFLEDTRDILVGYDGCKTEERLKGLIDETRERLSAFLNGTIEKYEED